MLKLFLISSACDRVKSKNKYPGVEITRLAKTLSALCHSSRVGRDRVTEIDFGNLGNLEIAEMEI